MGSFRRNRQPYLQGRSFRSEGKATTGYDEIDYARNQVLDACKRTGSLYAHWRRYTPEFNNGHCERCYNYQTHTPEDPRCPVCFGTGYEDGYSNPSAQFMILKASDRRVEFTESGFLRQIRMVSTSPYLPNIANQDILGEIQNLEGNWVVNDRYQVTGNVDKKMFRQLNEYRKADTFDHLDPETEVYGYKFEARRVTKHTDQDSRAIEYFVPFENIVWLSNPEDRS